MTPVSPARMRSEAIMVRRLPERPSKMPVSSVVSTASVAMLPHVHDAVDLPVSLITATRHLARRPAPADRQVGSVPVFVYSLLLAAHLARVAAGGAAVRLHAVTGADRPVRHRLAHVVAAAGMGGRGPARA